MPAEKRPEPNLIAGARSTEQAKSSDVTNAFVIVAGLLVVFVFPLIPYPRKLLTVTTEALNLSWTVTVTILNLLENIIGVVTLLILVSICQRRKLDSVGLTGFSVGNAILGVAVWVLSEEILVWILTITFKITHNPIGRLQSMPSAPLFSLPLVLRVAMPLGAAVSEEIGCRGFAIEQLRATFGSLWLAAAVSFALTMLAHIPFWGFRAVIFLAPGQVILTLLYCWRRSVVPGAVAHFLFDSYGLWLSALLRFRF